jgi:hypothetical protein
MQQPSTSYTLYNTSLIAFTLSFATPIHCPNNAIPVVPCFPPNPPNPFCLTRRIFGALPCADEDEASSESSAIVIVVSISGVSKAVGSGRRCSLSTKNGLGTIKYFAQDFGLPLEDSECTRQRCATHFLTQTPRLRPRAYRLIQILIPSRYWQFRYEKVGPMSR